MPGTPNPVGRGPAGEPVFWNAVLGAIKGTQQAVNGLASGAMQTNLVDQWGNVQVIVGQLNQIVTIGAAYQQAGVQVGTALPGVNQPNVGIAWAQNIATGGITLTKDSTSASLAGTFSGTFASGQVIGASSVNDPTTGTPTSAITPGTTFTISGSAITLSQPAAESGTALYCAACNWRNLYAITFP